MSLTLKICKLLKSGFFQSPHVSSRTLCACFVNQNRAANRIVSYTYNSFCFYSYFSLCPERHPHSFFPTPSHFQSQFIQCLLSAHFTPRNTSLTMALDLLYLNRTPATNHPKPLATELTQYMPTSGSYNYYVCIL